ncbi:MAG: hypothetical protein ACREGG_00595 [Candidatus Saccharimonadales bacterium]
MELLTSEEEELHTISSGLESQAELLERRWRTSERIGTLSVALAGVAAAIAFVAEHYGEKWPGEAYDAKIAFGALGVAAASSYTKGGGDYIKAKRKRRLANRLEAEADRLPVY